MSVSVEQQALHECYVYNKARCEFVNIANFSELSLETEFDQQRWLNVNELNVETIAALGRQLGLHELVVEDIGHALQRPKIDDHDDYVLITAKMPHCDENQLPRITFEQVSFLVFSNMLISFQEYPGDVFGSVRKRLNKSNSRLRQGGIDYLLYALFDNLIDTYMELAEQLSDQTDALETVLIEQTGELSLSDLYQVKRDMMSLRKALLPLRDVFSYLMQEELSWIAEKNIVFFKDCYDHIMRTLDNLDLQRDVIANVLDIYLSTQNNRMSEVMKVMAVFATIFIPLTFMTGLYGMNFEYMPGVKWHYGYYAILSVMGAAVAGLIVYFKKKRWF